MKNKYEKNKLKVEIIESEYIRSYDYRTKYFEKHKGINGYYICSYCGKVMNKDNTTIDHIFPINKVSKSKFLKKILKLINIISINDERNLTPCCKVCNSRKGNKLGVWTLLGAGGPYVILVFYLTIILIIGYLISRYFIIIK